MLLAHIFACVVLCVSECAKAITVPFAARVRLKFYSTPSTKWP